ncbi:hypothetical protein ACFLZV_00900 [Candidatus Margulisiibacteriota bacterium]
MINVNNKLLHIPNLSPNTKIKIFNRKTSPLYQLRAQAKAIYFKTSINPGTYQQKVTQQMFIIENYFLNNDIYFDDVILYPFNWGSLGEIAKRIEFNPEKGCEISKISKANKFPWGIVLGALSLFVLLSSLSIASGITFMCCVMKKKKQTDPQDIELEILDNLDIVNKNEEKDENGKVSFKDTMLEDFKLGSDENLYLIQSKNGEKSQVLREKYLNKYITGNLRTSWGIKINELDIYELKIDSKTKKIYLKLFLEKDKNEPSEDL